MTQVAPASGVLIRPEWWTKPRTLAAQLIAEGNMTQEQICAKIHKSHTWLVEFKRHEHVQERIAEIRQAIAAEVLQYGIAVKANRIKDLQRLHDQVQAVIDERGMIERTTTTTEHAEIVRERFARELPAEMRAILRAAAEETGQLEQPRGDTFNIDKAILVRYVEGPS